MTCRRASVRLEGGGGAEIGTEGEQRRRWPLEDKLRIVAEVEQPGAVLSAVARQHVISRNLLRQWRDQARRAP